MATTIDQRFAEYVFQRDTMWSLLLTALEHRPDYYDETIFKLCVFDNVEFCWTHHRVCDSVYYQLWDGSMAQTYVCNRCEKEGDASWRTWNSRNEPAVPRGNPYGVRYKRRVRTVYNDAVDTTKLRNTARR